MVIKKTHLVLLLLVFVLSGCQKEKQQNLTLAIWDSNYIPAYQKVIDKFLQENPQYEGITIRLDQIGYGDYWKKMDTGAKAKNLPDLFTMNAPNYLQYQKAGALLDIDDVMTQIDLSEYAAGPVKMYTSDGKLWALPLTFDAGALFYNKDLLNQAGVVDIPQTWDELVKASIAVKEHFGDDVLPLYIGYGGQEDIWNLVVQNGGTIIKEDGSSGYDLPQTKEALQFVHDLVFKYDIATGIVESAEINLTQGMLVDKNIAMAFDGSYRIPYFVEYVKEAGSLDNIGAAPIPTPSLDTPISGITHSLSLAGSAYTKNPELVKDFIAFTALDSTAKILAEGIGQSSSKLKYLPVLYESYPQFPGLKEISENAFDSAVPYYTTLYTGWTRPEQEMWGRVFSRDNPQDLDEGLQEVTVEMNKILRAGD